MNFFQILEKQFPDADLTIRIKSKGGIQSISVLPVSTEENDIQPLIVSGSPEELDEQFFELIKKPLQETITAIVNLEEQEQSVKQSASKPAPATATANKVEKPAKKDDKKAPSKKEIPAPPAKVSLFEEPEATSAPEEVVTASVSNQEDADTIQDEDQEEN